MKQGYQPTKAEKTDPPSRGFDIQKYIIPRGWDKISHIYNLLIELYIAKQLDWVVNNLEFVEPKSIKEEPPRHFAGLEKFLKK